MAKEKKDMKIEVFFCVFSTTMACTGATSKGVVVEVGQDFIIQIHMPVPEVFQGYTIVHTWEQWDRLTPNIHHPRLNHLTMY